MAKETALMAKLKQVNEKEFITNEIKEDQYTYNENQQDKAEWMGEKEPLYYKLAEMVAKQTHYFYSDKNPAGYYYDSEKSCWYTYMNQQARDSEQIRIVGQIMSKHPTAKGSKAQREVLSILKENNKPKGSDLFDQRPELYSFRNTAYNVLTGERIKNAPELYLINGAGYDLPREQTAREELKTVHLMNSLLGEDGTQLLLEYLGSAFYSGKFKNSLLFIEGKAGSGKSTLIELIENLFSDEAQSAVSPHALAYDRFSPVMLMNKDINIYDDIEADAIKKESILKKITEPGVYLEAERKGQDKFHFKSHAKHIFIANKAPQIPASDGMARRVILLKTIGQAHAGLGEQERIDVSEIKKEAGQVALLAMAEFRKAYEAKTWTLSKRIADDSHQYVQESDRMGYFIDLAVKPMEDERTRVLYLFEMFKNFEILNNRKPEGSYSEFVRKLEEKKIPTKRAKATQKQQSEWGDNEVRSRNNRSSVLRTMGYGYELDI